jgi:hypothetical protein
VELGDYATHIMKIVGSIYFHILSGDVLGLNDALFVPILKKKLLPVSYMVYTQCTNSFEGHHCIIDDWSLGSLRNLVRGVNVGGIYRFLIDPMELVHTNGILGEPFSFKEAYEN